MVDEREAEGSGLFLWLGEVSVFPMLLGAGALLMNVSNVEVMAVQVEEVAVWGALMVRISHDSSIVLNTLTVPDDSQFNFSQR